MNRLKKYKQFIKESIEIRLDHKGNPRCTAFEGGIEHGDIPYSDIENLNPYVIDEFIEEIVRCIEVNHEILATDLSQRVDKQIEKVFGDNIKWYFQPVDVNEDSGKFSFRYDDISIALAKLINVGYSIGYLTQKYSIRGWSFPDFFGYNGEVFTTEKDFKKISSERLDYKGVDVTHHSLLASSFNIKQSLSRKNIKYGENEQGRSEISVIFSRPFALGFDAGAKMVDAERDLYYEGLGTTYDRYYELMLKDDKTPEESEEYNEIQKKEDIVRYGEEEAKRMYQARLEFDALPKEEQERRKKENQAKLKELLAELLKEEEK